MRSVLTRTPAALALWAGLFALWVPGCASKRVQTSAVEIQEAALAATPRLPAPRAGTYTRLAQKPTDPVIAALVQGLTWDASLSGAAARLALDAARGNAGLYPWEIREAAWDAGYPYPVVHIRMWSTPRAAPPPDDLRAFLAELDPSVDLGLVRARGTASDVWLALLARPRASVGLQPRQVDLGDKVSLPALPNARYTVVDAAGRLYEGSTAVAQDFTMDLKGEWLFQVSDAEGVVAKFPIYVGMVPPDLGLLTASDTPLTDRGLMERVAEVFAELRGAYGLPVWERDMLLDAAARSRLQGGASDEERLASAVGFAPDRMWRLECKASTVEECVDRLMWSPYHRSALITDSRYWGLAAKRNQPGVQIVALVAAGDDDD